MTKLPKTIKPPKGYEDWKIEYHNGITEIPDKMELHLEPEQKGGYIKGEILVERLKETSLNGNHLDYLLKHQSLIPNEWKGQYVYFWGTVYRRADGYLYVRCLVWHGDGWRWFYGWLDGGWRDDSPAAVPASTKPSESISSSVLSTKCPHCKKELSITLQ